LKPLATHAQSIDRKMDIPYVSRLFLKNASNWDRDSGDKAPFFTLGL
jgi:hypothetical protein